MSLKAMLLLYVLQISPYEMNDHCFCDQTQSKTNPIKNYRDLTQSKLVGNLLSDVKKEYLVSCNLYLQMLFEYSHLEPFPFKCMTAVINSKRPIFVKDTLIFFFFFLSGQ